MVNRAAFGCRRAAPLPNPLDKADLSLGRDDLPIVRSARFTLAALLPPIPKQQWSYVASAFRSLRFPLDKNGVETV